MEDLKTITDIVNESVRNSSYVTVIISSSVYIIYTLIVRLIDYFKSRNKDKPLLEMSKAMKEMGDNIAKLNAVLSKNFEDAEKKEIRQCDKAIQLSFKAMGFKIAQECTGIIAHNNIDANKELIISNINKLVSTEYYRLYSTLSAYEINEVTVSSKLKEEWIREIVENIIDIIYDGQESIIRISQLNNRLTVILGEYSSYVNNKVFNQ
jgi:hypothetical protein